MTEDMTRTTGHINEPQPPSLQATNSQKSTDTSRVVIRQAGNGPGLHRLVDCSEVVRMRAACAVSCELSSQFPTNRQHYECLHQVVAAMVLRTTLASKAQIPATRQPPAATLVRRISL